MKNFNLRAFLVGVGLGLIIILYVNIVAGCRTSPPKKPWEDKSPQKMCEDITKVYCAKIGECKGDEVTCFNDAQALCSQVTGIRNQVELYNCCLPTLKEESCAEFQPDGVTPEIPYSCIGQLQ